MSVRPPSRPKRPELPLEAMPPNSGMAGPSRNVAISPHRSTSLGHERRRDTFSGSWRGEDWSKVSAPLCPHVVVASLLAQDDPRGVHKLGRRQEVSICSWIAFVHLTGLFS